MNYQISIRQFIFLYIFTTLTPLLTYVPQMAAGNAGNSGYLSALYFGVLLFIFAALLLRIMKVYPNQNLFQILSGIIGKTFTRIIFLLYGIWIFLLLLYKLCSYNLLMQATLMDNSTSYIVLFGMFFIVLYAAFKGPKTIFRVAELLYGPLIVFLILLLIFTLPNISKEYLAPVTRAQLRLNIPTIWNLAPVGGNLFFLLFFLKPVAGMNRYKVVKKRLLQSVFVFVLISFLSIFLTIGIAGATLTSEYSYSFFQAIKCITFLNSFDRFDAIINLVIVISDFITITFYLVMLMKCISLTFNFEHGKESAAICLTIACTIACVFEISQYNLTHIYRAYIETVSIWFQYLIPVILGIISCFKRTPSSEVS